MGLSHINRIQRILLDEGPMTVDQMISIIKGQTRQVPSSRQVNNILSKNPKLFFKHGKTKTKSTLNSRYEIIVWAHVNYRNEEE